MFRNDRSRDAFKTLNCKHKIWAERVVIIDEIDPAIRAKFESRGWLPLLEIDHPPPTALIREFFSNISCMSMIPTPLLGVGYEVLSSPLPLG